MTLTEIPQHTARADALVASVSADGMTAVVRLRGEADLFTLPVVVDVLARVTADYDGPVVVDLSETAFIDTGTVRALVQAWELLDDRGRTLTLRAPSSGAIRVLGLLGLSHLVEIDRIRAT